MLTTFACSGAPGGKSTVDAVRADAADADAAAGGCVSLPAMTSERPTTLTVAGEPPGALVRIDPSILWPPENSSGLLAYSQSSGPFPHPFATSVSRSSDAGATWQFVAQANTATPLTITTSDTTLCGSTSCSTQLSHEVPSIIVDPSDPDPSRRYKLFVHAYPMIATASYLVDVGLGYIGLDTSSDGSTWSADTKVLGWHSSSTLSSSGALTDLNADPALADCAWFTEPGAVIAPSGAIDLVLSCRYSGGVRLVLMRSTDHAQSFRYVGPLLSSDDARCLGSTTGAFIGGDLFYVGAQEYLLATPMGDGPGLDSLGLFVFPIADAETGALRRDGHGGLVVTRNVVGVDGTKLVTATYAEGASAAGYIGFYTPSGGGPPQLFASGIATP